MLKNNLSFSPCLAITKVRQLIFATSGALTQVMALRKSAPSLWRDLLFKAYLPSVLWLFAHGLALLALAWVALEDWALPVATAAYQKSVNEIAELLSSEDDKFQTSN